MNPIESAVRRADQVYCEQLAEKVTLDKGVAYYCRDFPHSVLDNSLREVCVESESQLERLWQQASAFYAERGLSCMSCVPAAIQQADVLGGFMAKQGFNKKTYCVMGLSRWPAAAISAPVRFLPARAVRKAFRSLCEDATQELQEQRLNDAQYDVVVGFLGQQPAVRGGLLHAGDVASIREVYVVPELRKKGLARALLTHLLEEARRLAVRVVCARVEACDPVSQSAFLSVGFESAGSIEEYQSTLKGAAI